MAVKSADQITLIDVTDAYSVILTSEAYTFVGGTTGVASGNSCSTQAVAFCGATQCSAVTVVADDIECPTGISASVTGSGTSAVTITFTTTATISSACEATIPVEVDGITVNKKFSFAVAIAGTSVTVKSKSVTYQVGTSGTTAPTGTWNTTIPTVTAGQYLWTKTTVEYSDGAKTEAYAVSYKAKDGENGTDADPLTITTKTITYQAGTSGTTTPTGTWSSTVPSVGQGEYLWTKTYMKYSDGTETTSYAVAYNAVDGQDGEDGEDGADAIHMTITASNGTVFKNSSGSTVLTAHVFVGGVEKTITDAGVVADSLGSVKWYKGTTSVKTAKTLTVAASEVSGSQAYTAQLE